MTNLRMSAVLGRGTDPPTLSWAMDVANRVRAETNGASSDWDLRSRLMDAASDEHHGLDTDRIVMAIVAVETAIRRRIGIWGAVLLDAENLSGPVKSLRLAADELIYRASRDRVPRPGEFKSVESWAASAASQAPVPPGSESVLRWLVIALARSRTEYHADILLPAGFYQSLTDFDDSGCLVFVPTLEQIAAAALLLRGAIVEMDAGEGKTLASAIAASVYAAAGRRVDVLTANDYLASRDCEHLAPAFESLGILPGLVVDAMDRDERTHQYTRQIVFTTAREVGFDYLRDSIASSIDRRVSPAFDIAIIDEVDHQLIDQARTPLIISGDAAPESVVEGVEEDVASEIIECQAERIESLLTQCADETTATQSVRRDLAEVLLAGGVTPRLTAELERLGVSTRRIRDDLLRLIAEDENGFDAELMFVVDLDGSTLRLTDRGWGVVSEGLDDLAAAFEVIQLLRARVLHQLDEDYVIVDDEVTLVDPLDGRPLFSHRYTDGLHEALEAKEEVGRRGRGHALARTTIQSLVSKYATIAGLSGTAVEEAERLAARYGAPTVAVPPSVPSRRVDEDSEVFFDRETHTRQVVSEVVYWNSQGRPVLLVVDTVALSLAFSQALIERGVEHEVLNAATTSRESEIVAKAGGLGAVTVATAMAGRGTDIVVESREDDGVTSGSGLLVLMASLPASRRVERQIRGRTGRQGGTGAAKASVYIGDPVLAFSRHQRDIMAMPGRAHDRVSGPEVRAALVKAQEDAESQDRAADAWTSEFSAVIERESRGYYAFRESLMGREAASDYLAARREEWVRHRTAPLYEISIDYDERYESVRMSLEDDFGIPLPGPAELTPAEVIEILDREVEARLFHHRTIFGPKAFGRRLSELFLNAVDERWPDHLALLQDMALSISLGAYSHAAAMTRFSEEARTAGAELRAMAADSVIDSLVADSEIGGTSIVDVGPVEELPIELCKLLTC